MKIEIKFSGGDITVTLESWEEFNEFCEKYEEFIKKLEPMT